ncbi:TetR/AcrR family transcriptional regulator [Bacillus haikouensis]|jgi:AcrR family transcriptional regulator|uniref:TetR/AcrR family transcriptional regulator n=1 Tax=Bacillus haikouensis TaxID=1510468 RepID=UPI0015545BE3|nr:TetR/AcrR family transcriptional regulator [Bacillus haikouensis]NQD65978.1 TetR/AcrR family transcriptional regulator [Bacillus haikouensis]
MTNRKRKVADIALSLFIEKGFQQTSIQEIIEKANISKGTFYNYFSSKNDCIADILEYLRYDTSQQRIAMQIGKDNQDREVFIEQITILMKLNEERNLSVLFEAILSSNEAELKKLVMQHRIYEMDWLSNRFIEVMGDEIREVAFEATVMFYGMLQYLLFTMRVTNTTYSLKHLADVVLSYIELIIPYMLENDSSVLNHSAIDLLQSNINKSTITLTDILTRAAELQKQHTFNEEQQDLLDAITNELQRERIRKSVLNPLLKPFKQLFNNTDMETHAHKFTNMVWYFLKSI